MPLLVSSLDDRPRETAVALALARAAADRGQRVGYMKPLTTTPGPRGSGPADGDCALARKVLDLEVDPHRLGPVVYSPAFVQAALRGREAADAVREQVRERFEALDSGHDRMVLEGSGSPSAGGVVGCTDSEVAALLGATVVLVAGYEEPGDVDDVLAAADRFGGRLGGILFDAVPDAAFDGLASDVVPFLEGRGVRVYGTVPRDEGVGGLSVADLAAGLGADVLTDGTSTDTVVERFVVGGTSAAAAPEQLRPVRDAALVAGGGRTDLQTAALAASGVDCLLLTGGTAPSEAVLGEAAAAGVPVLLVRTDAGTTLERARELRRSGPTLDAAGVAKMGELLADYADVDAMLAADRERP